MRGVFPAGHLARSPHERLETLLPALKLLGYDGVEAPLKLALNIPNFNELLRQNELDLGIIVFSDGPVAPGGSVPGLDGHWIGDRLPGFTEPVSSSASPSEIVQSHQIVFKEQVDAAMSAFDPAYINSHSGNDSFTRKMAVDFFEDAIAFDETVMHETHRKRYLHSPWVARDFVPLFPKLRLVADLSHWINVAETDTNDPSLNGVIDMLADRVYHVHCRVGYDHGPQVSDPRAPEWIAYMNGHEAWWDAIWKAQISRGQDVTTMMAEHGPPTYQQTTPHTQEPLASIWDINHWIHLRRQLRFAELYGAERSSRLVPSETQGFDPPTSPGSLEHAELSVHRDESFLHLL